MEKFDSERLNKILGKEIFVGRYASNDDGSPHEGR